MIAVVPDTPIYSATGEVTERFSAEELADDLRARGIPADAIEGVPAIVERLARDCRAGDVVIVMSNGPTGAWSPSSSRAPTPAGDGSFKTTTPRPSTGPARS